jgi:NADH:ubiquinone reductase (non-electrogenic)
MASTMKAALRLQRASVGANAVARRSLMTSSVARVARPSSHNFLRNSILRQSFRRGYAEIKPTASATPAAAAAPIAPPPKKPRRFRVLRWIWRATYLSLLGGVGYMAYTVYDLRHPEEQGEPDPNKQNLVILGTN